MITQLVYLGYCAGIQCVNGFVYNSDAVIGELKSDLRKRLEEGQITITFGVGQTSTASELCVDFYPIGDCKHSLGFAIKI